MQRVRLIAIIIASNLLLTLGCTVHADTAKAYQIEMIIFEHMSKRALTSERWPLTGVVSQPNQSITLTPSTSDQPYYKLLDPRNFTLTQEQTQLDQYISTYPTLLHIAWRQPVDSSQAARAVYISSEQSTNNSQNHTISQVSGTIRVSVQRYLNVKLNFTFTVPATKLAGLADNHYFAGAPGGWVHFHLQQTRRMRSDELNYVDFPLYGILIKITPL